MTSHGGNTKTVGWNGYAASMDLRAGGGQWRRLVKHAKRLDQAAIEEDPLGRARVTKVLLHVSPQNRLGEGERVRSTTRATRETFCDDGSSGFLDRCVASGCKLSQQRRFARARSAGEDDVRHQYQGVRCSPAASS